MDLKVTPGGNGSAGLFPIIGIGASAGGLNSLECFLLALPHDFDFAIVFIQHLSAMHGSLLPELLQKRLPHLKIHEISEGLEVLSGRLYLCTPGKDFLFREGTFHEAPRQEEHVHLPIDEFFASLAEEARERAIAVIFSGAGTDGARVYRRSGRQAEPCSFRTLQQPSFRECRSLRSAPGRWTAYFRQTRSPGRSQNCESPQQAPQMPIPSSPRNSSKPSAGLSMRLQATASTTTKKALSAEESGGGCTSAASQPCRNTWR